MLTTEEVLKVAQLANLRIPDGELAAMSAGLSDILKHIGQLDKLDTSSIPPTSHVLEMGNVFREDVVTSLFGHEVTMDNAPAQMHGYFSVPRIIE